MREFCGTALPGAKLLTKRRFRRLGVSKTLQLPGLLARATWIAARTLAQQLVLKRRELSRHASSAREARGAGLRGLRFVRRASGELLRALRGVRRCLEGLEREGVGAVALYGTTVAAEFLAVLAPLYGVRVTGVHDDYRRDRFLGREIRSPLELVATEEVVVIASFVTFARRRRTLEALGIPAARIRHV